MKTGMKQLRALSEFNVTSNRTQRRPQLWTLALGLLVHRSLGEGGRTSDFDLLGLNGTKWDLKFNKKIPSTTRRAETSARVAQILERDSVSRSYARLSKMP